ncbi:trans-aconitate 2-methyltransferase [Variovorax sp. OK605]|jgi:trans-aconitate 2-methyltransferase|uniref:trans-aconitate 2-methyltransferase n=1 Tax=unclassified Variovorax TaxID=663243 RepID=UPI0008CCB0E8|nr:MULTISPECIES: trans-aconitate 2-methyltransferase [unclassified Variovorax]SEJ18982.1 trans-aconitate 2-methyltransferase [Variovorax sp. OK202]SFC09927.1 trans-aconitate 2-methyltransferase [Variovorax sp. OK212]SFO72667.1 trans-aconitate 2-methyltransferase [Variovorax sp. OK605]
MLDWNPALYRRYEDERTRPAQELLARVPLTEAARVVDLGCGPGNSTELLVHRFPAAQVTGTDNSEAMLASARERLPQAAFELSDIATWAPHSAEQAPDLIYANASLQWVPDHQTLIPRLFDALAPGGVLAIQMPDNRQEPTHRLMRAVAAEAPWAEAIGDADRLRTLLLDLGGYYDLLAPRAAHVDVWHTIYQHRMADAAAIVEWVRGTGLKPFVDRLPADLQASYLAEYLRRVDAAYPARADGKRLLAFPRMFIVAQKGNKA